MLSSIYAYQSIKMKDPFIYYSYCHVPSLVIYVVVYLICFIPFLTRKKVIKQSHHVHLSIHHSILKEDALLSLPGLTILLLLLLLHHYQRIKRLISKRNHPNNNNTWLYIHFVTYWRIIYKVSVSDSYVLLFIPTS